MKDIDFDELDQAVSSVLKTPVEKVEAPKEAPVAAASVSEETKVEDVATSEAPVAPTAEPAPAAVKVPLAIKRRGQFMDVVHPSSDMTGKPNDTPVSPTPKVKLQPISPVVEPEASADAQDEPAETVSPSPAATDAPTPEVSAAPSENIESTSSDHMWPDPLDTMETQEEAKDELASPVTTVEDTVVEATQDEESSSETPFLSDTKVDKRPLDAFSADEVPAELPPSAAVAPAEPLPPELQPDVIAVEANPSDRVEEATEQASDSPAEAEKPSSEPGFNASIPQQYTTEASQADEDHSIFDTREYHQPLTPAKAKKRGLPGWLTALLVIILLVCIGAAGGYFWFQYGL